MTDAATAEDPLLSPAEAAGLLNVSVDTLRRWTAAGHLQHWRTPGGHRRYRRSAIEALLADRSAPTPS